MLYIVLIMVLIGGIGSIAVLENRLKPHKEEQINEIQPSKEPPPVEVKDPIKEQIRGMTLEEKIGQMVLIGVDGYTMDENSKEMIEKHHVGGIILYKKNVADHNQLLAFINSIKSVNKKNKVPLFLSVDEEGGRISRMPQGFKSIPTSEAIGKINNLNFSFEIGRIIGEEVKGFGFNMDFAPVLDINSNPENPVIGDRSFGGDSEVVRRLGIQTMKGLQSEDIVPVVKHFPGHGDTSVDSHVGLPVVNNDIERLKNFELIPFMDAIKNGADAIMIAHILLPKIDAENPASLSKTIITGLLKNDLGFQGVIMTDDMTMGAIGESYNIGEAAIKSVGAGNDIVMIAHEYDKQMLVINALKEGVEKGIILEDRIDKSVYKILKLKQKYGINNEVINDMDVGGMNKQIENVLNKYMKDR